MEYVDAYAAIQGRLQEQWDAEAADVTGASPPPELLFEGRDREDRLNGTVNRPWGRCTIRHTDNQRRTVGRSNKYTRSGQVTVQCFYPNHSELTGQEAQQLAIALARVAQKAFEGRRASGVTFSAMRVQERGVDASWYRADMVSAFAWDNR